MPLHLEQDPIKRLRSCLLISPFNSLDISEALLHFVHTAGVLTSNGTLGRTGLICRISQQQQISGPDLDSLKSRSILVHLFIQKREKSGS